MRKLIFTCIAAALATAPMASIVKAEDTTIIKRDRSPNSNWVVRKLSPGSLSLVISTPSLWRVPLLIQ